MIQLAGFWMALATFLSIWWGHVGVRWLEARTPSIWPPMVVLVAGGVILHIFSLFAPNLTLSGVASIVGVTLFWDAFEMYRQEKRVRKGHAPANPNNPRHAALLAAGIGITEDLLDREPTGYPVEHEPHPEQESYPGHEPYGPPAKPASVVSPMRRYEYYEEVEA
jgi:hypothetical protein